MPNQMASHFKTVIFVVAASLVVANKQVPESAVSVGHVPETVVAGKHVSQSVVASKHVQSVVASKHMPQSVSITDHSPSLLAVTDHGHEPDTKPGAYKEDYANELSDKEAHERATADALKAEEKKKLEDLQNTHQELTEEQKKEQELQAKEQQALEDAKKLHEQTKAAVDQEMDKQFDQIVENAVGSGTINTPKSPEELRKRQENAQKVKTAKEESKPFVPRATDAVADAAGNVGDAAQQKLKGRGQGPTKMDHIRAVVVFCCILAFMLIVGSVMGCLLYMVLKFLQPSRPKTEEEAKAIIDDLKKQRDDLLKRDQDLQKQVEEVQEKIDEARHEREEATHPADDSESPPEPRPSRRMTRRESVGQQPYLNPDGTYAMPDLSQFAENERLKSMKDAFAPILDKKDKIKDALMDRREVAVQKAHDILVAELKDAYEDVREASLQTSNPTQMLLGVADLPPIALLLAGMCVPMQLKSLLWFTMLDLLIKVLLFILTVIALATEHGVDCVSVMRDSGLAQWLLGEATGEVGKKHWVYPWMEVDAASLMIQILIRFAIMRLVNRTLVEVDEANDEHQKIPESENLLEAFQHLVDHALSSCGTTMLCYDRVVSSWPFWLLNFIAFFDFSWQIYGLTFLFNTPNYECQATLMRTVFRVRAVTFMLFLTWHVGVLLNAAMSLMVHSQSFTNTVVSLARKFDEDFSPPWLPICTILVRAFFARDQTDLDKMELRILRAQKRKLEHQQRLSMKRQEELSKQEANLDEQLTAIAEQQRANINNTDTNMQAQFLEEHRKKIEGIFNKVDLVMKTVKENQARANAAEAMATQGAQAAGQAMSSSAAAARAQAEAISSGSGATSSQ